MRVYLIDDRQLDYQEPTMPSSAEYLSNEEFIEIAESEGTVYSLEGFQKEWNNNHLFSDYGDELDQYWIRII
jgi:hypothetical protein